jgi:hypothetical protein
MPALFSHGDYVNCYCREEVLEKFGLISASPRPETILLLSYAIGRLGGREEEGSLRKLIPVPRVALLVAYYVVGTYLHTNTRVEHRAGPRKTLRLSFVPCRYRHLCAFLHPMKRAS